VLSTRALALEASGDLQAAAASAKKAVDTARGLGFAAREWSRLLHNAGYLVTSAGRPSEGLTFLEEAYETRMQEFGERHPRTLYTAIQRAYALRKLHRVDEAIAVLERVIELTAAPATGAVDTLAPQRQNALRQIGGAYIQRGGEGDRERALMAAEQAIDAWFSNPKNSIHRLQTAVGTLTDLVFESAEQTSAAARLRANADRATEVSGRPESASLFRAIATQRLMGDRYGRDAWKVFTDIATCRSDSALLIERFGATSSEAFEGEITLLLALERADDPALLAEAAALRASLTERTAANFGASSSRSRGIEQTRPKAP
jgi:tetratricopeptide (TPR) repeat protein